VLWFAIFLQLFLILGVLHTLASDAIAMHRFQISVFGAIAIVFAVIGVNQGIFTSEASLDAMSAGWLLLAIVDILWTLYFTSEEDSLQLHVFNSMGTGGLSPPSRRRRAGRGASMNIAASGGNGYTGSYAGGGIGPNDFDTKIGPGGIGAPMSTRSNGSIGGGSVGAGPRTTTGGSLTNVPTGDNIGAMSPLMGSGNAGVGAGGGLSPANTEQPEFPYRAKALYDYNASPDDANELSFKKGDLLEVHDKSGKWWSVKTPGGDLKIAPSNYLQLQ